MRSLLVNQPTGGLVQTTRGQGLRLSRASHFPLLMTEDRRFLTVGRQWSALPACHAVEANVEPPFHELEYLPTHAVRKRAMSECDPAATASLIFPDRALEMGLSP